MQAAPHNPQTPQAVSIADGEITFDARLVAARLGLTPEMFMAELARGIVYRQVEQGTGEDAGRTRVTFRYRAAVWRCVIDADGRLIEDAATNAGRSGPTTLPRR